MYITSIPNKSKSLLRKKDLIWESIFTQKNLHNHDFSGNSVSLHSDEIRSLTKGFDGSAKEPRILCRHITPNELPVIFKDNRLFCMPIKNKEYRIFKGYPFTPVPKIESNPLHIQSSQTFKPICYNIGNSEMQHLDYCFNAGTFNKFFDNPNPYIQTMRGRKYCKTFNFRVNNELTFVEGVQYETDGVYENEDEIIICEAKNNSVNFIHNRQFFYPYKDISLYAKGKPIRLLLFCHNDDIFSLWEYKITNPSDFNSITFVKSQRFLIN